MSFEFSGFLVSVHLFLAAHTYLSTQRVGFLYGCCCAAVPYPMLAHTRVMYLMCLSLAV